MTEAMIEEPQATEWVEMEPKQPAAAANPPRPPLRIWGPKPDAERAPGGCRCWRCSGAPISVMERGPLDRILARHLLRMTELERDDWLGQWCMAPGHGPQGIRALQAWITIEQGKSVPEPKYSAGRAG